METAGEERVRAAKSLKHLEDASLLLENACKNKEPQSVSPGFPQRISGILNALTAISSRDDAERMLAAGVSMWNSVIALEGLANENSAMEAIVKVRHVAADCIYMAITVLGGISARFDIDEVSLLKFYTACGQKYVSELSDIEMASVCYAKAEEFQESATEAASRSNQGTRAIARAIFDLKLGQAECAWDCGDTKSAESLVSKAKAYVEELPEEREYLASVEFNFGLFMYQEKQAERALDWLNQSFATRDGAPEGSIDKAKQAKTARLAGICLLAMKKYDQAQVMMEKAEEVCHDAVGAYLLLKLAIIMRSSQSSTLLSNILEDRHSSLDICMASVALMADAQRLREACKGYESVYLRFSDDPKALVSIVGPRYFESLTALGKSTEAITVLNECCKIIDSMALSTTCSDSRSDQQTGLSFKSNLAQWSAMALASGCAYADRKDFKPAVIMLQRSLEISRHMKLSGVDQEDWGSEAQAGDQISSTAMEAATCRLLASCSIYVAHNSIAEEQRDSDQVMSDVVDPSIQFSPTELAISTAKRARELEPDDFAARLLLFRAYLLQRRPDLAADEMRKASEDIRYFDAGGLAEAACSAKDVGSLDAVLSALRFVLEMNGEALKKSLVESPRKPLAGFFGSVLVAAASIALKDGQDEKSSQSNGDASLDSTVGSSEESFQPSIKKMQLLSKILSSGLRGLKELGPDIALGDDANKKEASLSFLSDVAWNCGRRAGKMKLYELWGTLFDTCYGLSCWRVETVDILQSQRIALIMSATSIIESDKEPNMNQYQIAKKRLIDARGLTSKLAQKTNESPSALNGLLAALEARCYVAMSDENSLACLVEGACMDSQAKAGMLEQLAAICAEYPSQTSENTSEARAWRNEMVCKLLQSAVDRRLSSKSLNIADIAVTLRELITTEVARGEVGNRSFQAFSRATGLLREKGDDYPREERRWLAALSWDRAQMLARTGRTAEARRWIDSSIEIAASDPALATYLPRISAFKATLEKE